MLGGASSDLQTVYDEIWTLDLNTLTWEKVVDAGTGESVNNTAEGSIDK